MKITRLEIKDFKNIGNLVMENIPNLVIIAGPNGTGKSSIFDALRIFKEAFGSYRPTWGPGTGVGNIIKEIGRVVPENVNESEVSVEIEFSDPEVKKLSLPGNRASGRISINSEGRVDIRQHDPGLGAIFSKYDLDNGIGIIEYIPPERNFIKEAITSLSFSQDREIESLLARVMNPRLKFERLKSDLVRLKMIDLQNIEKGIEGIPCYIEEIKKVFRHFLPQKEFLGVEMRLDAPAEINIRTSSGNHSVDFLSSGEKEILMSFTNIVKLKLTNSVILFDEPELHLNGDLERKVISYLKKFLEESNNQVWIATHSPDVVNSVDYENLYQTTGDPSNSIVKISDQSERIRVLKALGASVGHQLISEKIIFVEGDSDDKILKDLYPDLLENISIIYTGGKGTLLRINQVTSDYLNKAATYSCFFFIRDKDSETNEEIEALIKGHRNKFFVWNRYHLENYLVDPQAIFALIKENQELPQLSSSEEVEVRLKNMADEMQDEVIAQRISDEINKTIRKLVQINPKEGIEHSLNTIAERRLSLINKALSPENRSKLIKEITQQVKENWDKDWMSLCKGKDLLQNFLTKILNKAMDFELFRGMLARKIRQMDRVHKDIRSTLGTINRS